MIIEREQLRGIARCCGRSRITTASSAAGCWSRSTKRIERRGSWRCAPVSDQTCGMRWLAAHRHRCGGYRRPPLCCRVDIAVTVWCSSTVGRSASASAASGIEEAGSARGVANGNHHDRGTLPQVVDLEGSNQGSWHPDLCNDLRDVRSDSTRKSARPTPATATSGPIWCRSTASRMTTPCSWCASARTANSGCEPATESHWIDSARCDAPIASVRKHAVRRLQCGRCRVGYPTVGEGYGPSFTTHSGLGADDQRSRCIETERMTE
jgi:hypothetical protein